MGVCAQGKEGAQEKNGHGMTKLIVWHPGVISLLNLPSLQHSGWPENCFVAWICLPSRANSYANTQKPTRTEHIRKTVEKDLHKSTYVWSVEPPWKVLVIHIFDGSLESSWWIDTLEVTGEMDSIEVCLLSRGSGVSRKWFKLCPLLRTRYIWRICGEVWHKTI